MQEEVEAHQVVTPADNSKLIGTGQSSTYGTVTKQDVQVWKNETYKTAVYGSTVFHSGDYSAARLPCPATCAIPERPTPIPKLTPSSNRNSVGWRCCAT